MLKPALWGVLSVLLAVSIGCGGQADTAASSSPHPERAGAHDAASRVEDSAAPAIQPSMTVLPASVEWPIPDSDGRPSSEAVDDGTVAKTIYVDITWDENYNYIFEFDEPLTVPAGKRVRFIVTNTFTDPDECW